MIRCLSAFLISILFGTQAFPAPPADTAPPHQKSMYEIGPPAPALRPVKPEIIFRGPGRNRKIALTFDACMADKMTGYDRRIVNILLSTHTSATFFLGGKWMLAHRDETLFLSLIPFFELANHSYSHPDLTKVSPERIHFEMKKTQDIMYHITGKQGVFFRAPYGRFNEATLGKAGDLGLRLVQWSINPSDPDPKMTAERMCRWVLGHASNGSIIILHANGMGVHTHELLQDLIEMIREMGFEFVTVSELLEKKGR